MTNDAIIGHTGFVGGTLARQHVFDKKYNSSNIETIGHSIFDTVVCAAAPGSMFIANRYPDRDRDAIDKLIEQLSRVRTKRFVLISSIAVLADFAAGVDESTAAFEMDLAYGHNRRLLEAFCESHFQDCLVVRLPALFGRGLRKNFLFDLMNPLPSMLPEAPFKSLIEQLEPDLRGKVSDYYTFEEDTQMYRLARDKLNADLQRPVIDAAVRALGASATQFHNPNSTFQYYDMALLWQDIQMALEAGLSCVHLTVAPLRAADIHARLLGADMADTGARLHHEDMRTIHAHQWGCEGPYLEDAETVLNKLTVFFNEQRHVS